MEPNGGGWKRALWSGRSGKGKALVVVIALVGVFSVIGALGSSDDSTENDATPAAETTAVTQTQPTETYPSGNPDVYRRIEAMDDCQQLQAEFDQADENRGNQPAGSEQAEWSTNYMAAADDRMKEVGCYG